MKGYFYLIAVLFVSSCAQRKTPPIFIVWDKQSPVAIAVDKDLFKDEDDDSIALHLQVSVLPTDDQLHILGDVTFDGSDVLFTPIVPLTPGLTYRVNFDGVEIGSIEVPFATGAKTPSLEMIYPSTDTVPENLLKVYLRFSEPMVTGSSLKHITVMRSGRDTMNGTFLDLQPELWNEEGTMLTLWLDPGRIKRDLIPNKEKGIPIEEGYEYNLTISPKWKSRNGLPLGKSSEKKFLVVQRDTQKPDYMKWTVTAPASGTKELLYLRFGEHLDYSLIMDAISVVAADGTTKECKVTALVGESGIMFEPTSVWAPGTFRLKVESRLEDLAGNNLNRLFDQDVNEKDQISAVPFIEIPFTILK